MAAQGRLKERLIMSKPSTRSRTFLRLALCGAIGAATASAAVLTSPEAAAKPTVKATKPKITAVRLRDIENALVPSTLVRGDREFGGNGPDITCSADLTVSTDRRSVVAKIFFEAVETKGDRSTTRQTWKLKVYNAPAGQKIDRILSSTHSEVRFRSVKGGFQFLAPGTDARKFFVGLSQLADKIEEAETRIAMNIAASEKKELNDFLTGVRTAKAFMPFQSNHVHTVAPKHRGAVSVFAIVGDTGGDDISDDNNGNDDTRIVGIRFSPARIKFL
ncbi:MAG TPA: hypothetical protein PKA88_11820 [Polyangiaceae bacterium]|nr:hypothetical protein [Polyangiaceae bacterium]HMR76156.1 hypothetical protein [Polyangiaceae bacterium]